jgi:YD repeat-containing protein
MNHRQRNLTVDVAITLIIGTIICLVFIAAFAVSRAHAQQSPQERFYDARGNSIGTATTSGNQTTFRDQRGNTTGTATTSNGVTTFRDSRGNVTGTQRR